MDYYELFILIFHLADFIRKFDADKKLHDAFNRVIERDGFSVDAFLHVKRCLLNQKDFENW